MTTSKGDRGRPWEPLPGRSVAPTPIRQSLDHLAATMGLGSIESIDRLFLSWSEIVGPEVADHCRPKRLSDGVLTVEAIDQQWATELSWMTELIAQRCCDALGAEAVHEVRITR